MGFEEHLNNYIKSFMNINISDYKISSSENVDIKNLTPIATTVVALKFDSGVVMAGDRRATQGNYIAHDDVVKVYKVDDQSMIGIAGSAAVAFDLVKRFKTELEHYEKIQNIKLSYPGKVSFLSSLVKSNMNLIFQGLIVIPIFAGRNNSDFFVHTYDALGGSYLEQNYASVGSGSSLANVFLQNNYKNIDKDGAIKLTIESLKTASNNDSATAGINLEKDILPTVLICNQKEVKEVSKEEIKQIIGAK
ncbi:MAG: proteasome subunit beta [Actinomycetota bacterium]|nr:proteasome subunit beta [Actinomycetota bacterium]MDA3013009.1 proteasome subunit beta [Actinomycetota bacterium]